MIEIEDILLDRISDWFESQSQRSLYETLARFNLLDQRSLSVLKRSLIVFITIENYIITVHTERPNCDVFSAEDFFSQWYDVERPMFGLTGPMVATRLPLHTKPHVKE